MVGAFMKKITKLQQTLEKQGFNGYILPSCDEFLGEYAAEHLQRLKWLTGFAGSNGIAVILNEQKVFFTDGRYTLQAKQDLPDFEIHNLKDLSPAKWLAENLGENDKIAFDPFLFSKIGIDFYQKTLGKKFTQLIASDNPIDKIWRRKLNKKSRVELYPIEYSGKTTQEKIRELLPKIKQDALILTDYTSICWLLNIRGRDLATTPIILSYAIIHKNGKIELFANAKLKRVVEVYFKENHITLKPLAAISDISDDISYQADPRNGNYWFFANLSKVTEVIDPCLLAKACKNKTEQENIIAAHIWDGEALTKFIIWLKEQNPLKMTEIKAAKRLERFRRENKEFLLPSFPTISSFGSNGAIIHYQVNRKSNKKFTQNGLYLVDSGGQYREGTTDVTRVILIGKATQEQKTNYTLVLKGHIALASAEFTEKTATANLDKLARNWLQKAGLDYDHGTGHGVGCFLSVHEGPQRISRVSNNIGLKEGMVVSNEPGYYKEGEYGIRIENLLLVVKAKKKGFLRFQKLTLAPYEEGLIDYELLTQKEKIWLKEYHKSFFSSISSKV
jgi:Xaa-Pro aminopeptidase